MKTSFKTITFILAMAFFCDNAILASPGSGNNLLSPNSAFDGHPIGADRRTEFKTALEGQTARPPKILKKQIRKVLLINAVLPEKHPRPPVGLWQLASYLTKVFGEKVEVKVLDMALQDKERYLEDFLSKEQPDIVGISTPCTLYANLATDIAKRVKGTLNEAIVVSGGIHPSVAPEKVLETDPVDFLVQGNGEITLSNIIRTISGGDGDISKISGIWYKKDAGELVCTGDGEFPEMDDLSILPPGDVNVARYTRLVEYFGGERAWCLTTQTGCPIGCLFCSVSSIWGRKIRAMSAEHVVKQMKLVVQKYGITNFNFYDDAFTFDMERAKRIAELILADEELPQIKWKITTRADKVTKELLEIMAKAGLTHISFGVESADPEVLRKIGKRASLDDYRHATEWAHEYGIRVRYLLMVGLPLQDSASIDKTIEFLRRTRPDEIIVAVHMPFPGSKLSMNLEQYGTVIPQDFDFGDYIMREEKGTGRKPERAVPTRWMTEREILAARQRIIDAFNRILQKNIKNLIGDLRNPDMRKRRVSARRLLGMKTVKEEPAPAGLSRIMPGLRDKFISNGRLVIALAGPAAVGKFTLASEIFPDIIGKGLNIDPANILSFNDGDYLLPLSERVGADFLQKFELDRFFNDIKALQEGRVIYKPLYDRRINSRVRLTRQKFSSMLSDDRATLMPGTNTIYRLIMERVEVERRFVEEVYVDTDPDKNNSSDSFDLLEKVDPNGKVVIVRGTITLLDPEINEGYDERIFLTADFNTKLIRAVRRYRTGLIRGLSEDEYVAVLRRRIETEDNAYILPTKPAATIILNNEIGPKELRDVLSDTNPLVQEAARCL